MVKERLLLMNVFEGWNGYQHSLLKAISPLTREQLVWRPASHLRSVGELARHIALGRVDWFARMDAPGSRELTDQIKAWEEDQYGNRYVVHDAVVEADQASELIKWLEASWEMIDKTLKTWTVDDLMQTYRHTYRGTTYAVSHQWTLWRIMAHDLHHGGELAMMLGLQGLKNFELGDMGGHIVEPPTIDQS